METLINQYVTALQTKFTEIDGGDRLGKIKVESKISNRFAKIVTSTIFENQPCHSRSAYAFISLKDFETKTLGKIKAGDLFKPASWNAPTKHARGNIIEDMNKAIENSNRYGVIYLK